MQVIAENGSVFAKKRRQTRGDSKVSSRRRLSLPAYWDVSGRIWQPSTHKAAEHRRTPQRKREIEAEITATFWSAAVLRRFQMQQRKPGTFFTLTT